MPRRVGNEEGVISALLVLSRRVDKRLTGLEKYEGIEYLQGYQSIVYLD